MILHQKLIVLLGYKEYRYQLVVLSKASFSILLLQEHIGGMKGAESLFQHIFLSYCFSTELQLGANSEHCRIVFSHRFEILDPYVSPLITSPWKNHRFLVIVSIFQCLPEG